MKKILITLLTITTTLIANMASAHMFWINLVDSKEHNPAHIMTSLGFGHVLPMDDFLASKHGVIKLNKYQVYGPDMKFEPLGLPDTKVMPPKKTDLNLEISTGALGVRKLDFSDSMKEGTYQVYAESTPMFFTKYMDTSNKIRMAPKSMDDIKNLKKVIGSFKYQSFAKAYFSNGQWTSPKAIGSDLEILPMTDLTNIHANDMVRFKVKFKGKSVTSNSKRMRYLMCSSNTFGGPDGYKLASMMMDGNAQFRIPTPGQWVVNIYYDEDVDQNKDLKNLKGKCTKVYTAASIFFNVKP